MKTIKDVDISGKRVFVRVDFNVPLDEDLNISDDTRIKAALPTLAYAVEQGAKLIVASHLGRPTGPKDKKFSLYPVAERLGQLLEKAVEMVSDCIGPEVREYVDRMAAGEIVLLENLRFYPEEKENNDGFARGLADLCDVYVNDAFAVSHRTHASVGAITKYVPVCVAGMLLNQELEYFHLAMTNPQRPLAAVLGGAKVSSKLTALENMLHHVDKIIIGGAMANTFLKHTGCDVGASRVEDHMVDVAGAVLARAARKDQPVFLPVDVVVADRMDALAETQTVSVEKIPAEKMALDIGPATSRLFDTALLNAGTIIWNGPMGVFEIAAFRTGTLEMARSIARTRAVSIVGGGDTDAAVHLSGEIKNISYISTGGGAFLALMEGKTLPGVAAIEQSWNR